MNIITEVHPGCACVEWANLPLEIVLHIMDNLSYSDRLSAGNVCKQWHSASVYHKYFDNEEIVILHLSKEELNEIVSDFNDTSRQYFNFRVIDCSITIDWIGFWEFFGPKTKSLTLCKCKVNPDVLVLFLKSFSQLEFLEIDYCSDIFSYSELLQRPDDQAELKQILKYVRHMSLSCNMNLNDSVLFKLLSLVPNISSLSLAFTPMQFHDGIVKKFYPGFVKENWNISDNVLTGMFLIHYLKTIAPQIKLLDLSSTTLNNVSLSRLSQMKELNLQELFLLSCRQLSSSGIIDLINNQQGLRMLYLSNSGFMNDEALIMLSTKLPFLEVLSITHCDTISDDGLRSLAMLPKLMRLRLCLGNRVTCKGVLEGVVSKLNLNMRHFKLQGNNVLNSEIIEKITVYFPNLTVLDLSDGYDGINNNDLQVIIAKLPYLKGFCIQFCNLLTDAGFTGIEQKMKFLSGNSEYTIVNSGHSLSEMKGLLHLGLEACCLITDFTLQHSIKYLELKNLNLSLCPQITCFGLQWIALNNPSLETLDLEGCINIKDEGVTGLLKKLKRLRRLNLQGCHQLTNGTTDAVLAYGSALRFLNISKCPNIFGNLEFISCKCITIGKGLKSIVIPPNRRRLYIYI